MQPFDALSIRAILSEARPQIVNRRVDRLAQLGRDEILLSLRGKTGMSSLFISAQSANGRICLVPQELAGGKEKNRDAKKQGSITGSDRYLAKSGTNNSVSSFCLVLRKHLTGAFLLAADQPTGERVVDLVFSCTDEVGTTSLKILSAEIMGRHSNLIFWEKETGKILAASHNVTHEMSRHREIAPGLRYTRPPGQDRPSLYLVDRDEFIARFEQLKAEPNDSEPPRTATIEQWLIATFTGAGKHLCEEIVAAAGLPTETKAACTIDGAAEKLFEKVFALRSSDIFHPFMFSNLGRFSLFGWLPVPPEIETKNFDSVNAMVEEYFRSAEFIEQFKQMREQLKAELKQEFVRVESRVKMASTHVREEGDIDKLKKYGDLLFAHMAEIEPGQEVFETEDIFADVQDANQPIIKIRLDPELTTTQNAQAYYKQYARSRARHAAASQSIEEAKARLATLENQISQVEGARDIQQLRNLKDHFSGRKPHEIVKPKAKSKKSDSKILSVPSSDGWTIYVGRNRSENDYLLSRLAQPSDLWFHVLGQGGAHVLIRIPSSKQEPPQKTIFEAAQIAARLSKATIGTKVRVIYTQCRHVRKLAKEKPGVVKYENERTIEVDTAEAMSTAVKQLFNPDR